MKVEIDDINLYTINEVFEQYPDNIGYITLQSSTSDKYKFVPMVIDPTVNEAYGKYYRKPGDPYTSVEARRIDKRIWKVISISTDKIRLGGRLEPIISKLEYRTRKRMAEKERPQLIAKVTNKKTGEVFKLYREL